jgi:hypothetical protein
LTYLNTWPGEPVGRKLIASIDDTFHISKNSIVGLELAFIGTMLGLALAFFLLVFLGRFGSAALGRFILDPLACLILLAAAPACWIYSILHAGGLFWFSGYPAWPRESGFSSLVLEVSIMTALLYGARRDQLSLWWSVVLLFLRFVFWGW